jgi:energy-coupling factor transporter ATP-binding protein EcfA2
MLTEQHDQTARLQPAADVLAQLRGVYKRFGQIEALRGVDLAIYQGEVVALLGPNSAGKTTTISILLGVRRPDRGEAWLFRPSPSPPPKPQERGGHPAGYRVPGRPDRYRSGGPGANSLSAAPLNRSGPGALRLAGPGTAPDRRLEQRPETAASCGSGLRRQPRGDLPGRTDHRLGRRGFSPSPARRGLRRPRRLRAELAGSTLGGAGRGWARPDSGEYLGLWCGAGR